MLSSMSHSVSLSLLLMLLDQMVACDYKLFYYANNYLNCVVIIIKTIFSKK